MKEEKRTYVIRNTESRVGEGTWEGGQHGGLVRIISVQIGDFNLQGDVLLFAE